MDGRSPQRQRALSGLWWYHVSFLGRALIASGGVGVASIFFVHDQIALATLYADSMLAVGTGFQVRLGIRFWEGHWRRDVERSQRGSQAELDRWMLRSSVLGLLWIAASAFLALNPAWSGPLPLPPILMLSGLLVIPVAISIWATAKLADDLALRSATDVIRGSKRADWLRAHMPYIESEWLRRPAQWLREWLSTDRDRKRGTSGFGSWTIFFLLVVTVDGSLHFLLQM